jgi:tRNA modification GTPase
MQNDTIAAIATPTGVGGVGIIRVSGGDAFTIVQPLFRRPGKSTAIPPSHQLTYGHIIDPATNEVLDEVLVAFMSAPHTYTREDVVEIQGHGGPLILRRILRSVLAQGARMANPGEFTLRAFLNGRLDLAQAEAVMDLIDSQTEAGQRLAMQQLRGRLSEQIQAARLAILGVMARIEASIDFPEDDIPTPGPAELLPLIAIAQQQVTALLAGSEKGRLYRQGLRTAIIGRPNVGKSSLLNALLRMERAIVTPIAGTTRDTVEEVANLRGIPLHLIDTAGITPSNDPVEQMGVQRSRAAAESADVVLLVFDASEPLTVQDRAICAELSAMGFGPIRNQSEASPHTKLRSSMPISQVPGLAAEASSAAENMASLNATQYHQRRPVILVLNKADKVSSIQSDELEQLWPKASMVQTSTVNGAGLSQLEDTLAELVLAGSIVSGESVLVTSARHQDALRRSGEHLLASMQALQQQLPLDFISIDLRAAYDALGEVTGKTASDDLLDRIFSQFCIGK